ncbi:hypothetical protein [Streptomyces sp. NPDC051561]|uniref:hypothetical protein n=1 Tax=Streptomyces sp. NPDC051561 TaxID=3365658 RepID=UPI0037B20D10
MARDSRKPRRLVVEGEVYLWKLRHRHRELEDGRAADCSETLVVFPQSAGRGGPLHIVFAPGPGRYVPEGYPTGSGDVGFVRGGQLNLHEPGAVRALLDAVLAQGWRPAGQQAVEVDGWPLLEAAARARGA